MQGVRDMEVTHWRFSSGGLVLQQFAYSGSPGLMEGAPQGCLHCFQVGSPIRR
jgi:hypothetical protein